jgi:hypothetical protein
MIVITGKLDELFVRWSTQTLPPPPPSLADFDRCSRHSGLKRETKTKLKVLLKVTSSQNDFSFRLIIKTICQINILNSFHFR